MTDIRRSTLLALKGYSVRTETYLGQEHVVVPVVALVEGVVHAMNSQSAEFVAAEEFSRAPAGWNGRPIFLGHPMREGRPVSGNSPQVLEDEQIGIVFNSKARNNKLTMEAWINVARAEQVAPPLLQRVKSGDPIEISVGVMVTTDDAVGTYLGKPYKGAWTGITPDHLALLPETDEGACNAAMGCGVRAAANPEGHNQYTNNGGSGFYGSSAGESADKETAIADKASAHANKNYPATNQQKADKHSDAAVAQGKAADAHAAAAKDVRGDEVQRDYHNIMAEGHRSRAEAHTKAAGIYATIDKPAKKKRNARGADVTGSNGFIARLMTAMPGLRSLMGSDDMTNNDLLRKLYEAVKAKYPTAQYADQYYPATNPNHVVFTCSQPSSPLGPESGMGYQYKTYDMAFTLGDNGAVTLDGEAVEVEAVMRYEPTTRSASDAEPKVAAAGTPCSCQHSQPIQSEEKDMNKNERVTALIGKSKVFTEADRAMLEGASEDQLARFEAANAAPAAEIVDPAKVAAKEGEVATKEPVVEPKVAAAAAVAAAPTFDQLLQAADADTRSAIETGIRSAKSKKAATITALKATGRCKMTDEQLGSKTQDELDQLVELAGSNVRAAIDFSAQGGPRQPETVSQEAPVSQDLGAAIRAAREKK